MRGGVANGRDGGDGGGGFVAATNMTFAGSPSSFGRGAPSSPNLSNLSSNSPFLSPPSPPPRTSASYSNGLSVKVEPLVERADSLSRIESLGLGTEIPLPPLDVSGGEREGAVSPGALSDGPRSAGSVGGGGGGGGGGEGSFQGGRSGPASTGAAAASSSSVVVVGGGVGDGKDSLRRLFNLPPEETLIEEYMCALYKKILLQGRMYLFSNHVCFYSNVFGYQKNKVIALKNVTIINRAHTMNIVPNAIEIVCNGKCEFFTSFIFPDKAYRTITAAWKECSRYSKIFAAADLDQSERTTSTSSVPQFAVPPSPEIAAMLGLNPSESGGGGGPGSAGSGGGEGFAGVGGGGGRASVSSTNVAASSANHSRCNSTGGSTADSHQSNRSYSEMMDGDDVVVEGDDGRTGTGTGTETGMMMAGGMVSDGTDDHAALSEDATHYPGDWEGGGPSDPEGGGGSGPPSGASASGVAAALAALGRAPGGILRRPKKGVRSSRASASQEAEDSAAVAGAARQGEGVIRRVINNGTRRFSDPTSSTHADESSGRSGGGTLPVDISTDGVSAEEEEDDEDGIVSPSVAAAASAKSSIKGNEGEGSTALTSKSSKKSKKRTPSSSSSGEIPVPSDIPVPTRPSDMKTLEEVILECSVNEFFSLGWSDSARAGFNDECHRSRGETGVQITEWSRHKHHGHARDLTFVAPTNSSIGPKVTNCHQTQSYHLCRGGVLVIDTSQVMADIPYGDYFRVESRWEVSPTARDDGVKVLKVWVGLRIPFHRSTMLRKVIEQGTLEQSKQSVATVLGLMRDKLRERKAAAAAAAAASPTASPAAAAGNMNNNNQQFFSSAASHEAGGGGGGGGGLQRSSGGLGGGGGDGEDRVDVSKLNIPEGSKDIIWRMLFGGVSAKKTGNSGDNTPRGGGGGGGGGFGATPQIPPSDAGRAGSLGCESGERSNATASNSDLYGLHRSPSDWSLGGGGGGGGGGGDYPSPRVGDYDSVGRRVFGGIFGSGGLLGGGFGVVALIVLSGVLILALQVAWVLSKGVFGGGGGGGVGSGSLFGWRGWGSGIYRGLGISAEADVAFWQRRAALLSVELETLERRVAFVAAEVAHAQGVLKEASERLSDGVAAATRRSCPS